MAVSAEVTPTAIAAAAVTAATSSSCPFSTVHRCRYVSTRILQRRHLACAPYRWEQIAIVSRNVSWLQTEGTVTNIALKNLAHLILVCLRFCCSHLELRPLDRFFRTSTKIDCPDWIHVVHLYHYQTPREVFFYGFIFFVIQFLTQT